MMEIIYYKVLREDRRATHCDYIYPPPGEWTPLITDLRACESGYHVCRGAAQLLHWLGPVIWGVEVDGGLVEAEDQCVVGRVRLVERVTTWAERSARLYAADCAEHVLRLYESRYPGDDRPRRAIEAARAYARGEIDDAARAAARDAAWAAAWAAARDAARAAGGDAAWDAAWAAARAAAWAAARDAARDAAWAAARDAAWAAAWAAARAAERSWQADRLRQYLTGAVL